MRPSLDTSFGVENLVEALKARNIGVLIISRSLDQVLHLTDRIYVLRRDNQIGICNSDKTDKNEIIAMITGVKRRRPRAQACLFPSLRPCGIKAAGLFKSTCSGKSPAFGTQDEVHRRPEWGINDPFKRDKERPGIGIRTTPRP